MSLQYVLKYAGYICYGLLLIAGITYLMYAFVFIPSCDNTICTSDQSETAGLGRAVTFVIGSLFALTAVLGSALSVFFAKHPHLPKIPKLLLILLYTPFIVLTTIIAFLLIVSYFSK